MHSESLSPKPQFTESKIHAICSWNVPSCSEVILLIHVLPDWAQNLQIEVEMVKIYCKPQHEILIHLADYLMHVSRRCIIITAQLV